MRIIDKREDFKIKDNVPIASNMYPVTSCLQYFKYPMSEKKNEALQKLSIMPDRPIAAGMYYPNFIDLLLQRKHRQNDGKGIGEPLVERDADGLEFAIRQQQTLLFQLYENEKDYHRDWEYLRDTAPTVWHASSNEERFKKQEVIGVSALTALHQSGILMKHADFMRVDYIHRMDNTTFLRVMNMKDDKGLEYPNIPYPYV